MPVRIENVKAPGTRIRQVSITPELLLELFKSCREPRTLSMKGLPDDASLVSCTYDPHFRMIRLLIASESFDELPAGSVVEEIAVTFTEHHEQVAVHR